MSEIVLYLVFPGDLLWVILMWELEHVVTQACAFQLEACLPAASSPHNVTSTERGSCPEECLATNLDLKAI